MEALQLEIVHYRIALARIAVAMNKGELIPGNTDGNNIGWDQMLWLANSKAHDSRPWMSMVNKLTVAAVAHESNSGLYRQLMQEKYGPQK